MSKKTLIMNLFKFRKKVSLKSGSGEKQLKNEGVKRRTRISIVTWVKEFVAGDVFLKEAVQKQFLFVIMMFVLSLVYVNNRFLYEKQLREVDKLRSEVVDLRYRSLAISKEAKLMGRRTKVAEILNEAGSEVTEALEPIIIIED